MKEDIVKANDDFTNTKVLRMKSKRRHLGERNE